ncbi:MAG: NAD(P)H-hydrate dehydratase [Sphingomonas sp.]|nr:NAD(P)H-hydrate dehydratase [Sphingomonas sp.]
MRGRPILTTQAMRAAEQSAIDAGTKVETLMESAGAALAEAAVRYAGPLPALVLCDPGNNGGDGYVAARHLAERGIKVRVAALAGPASDACSWARGGFDGEVERLGEATEPAPMLIDALFGTGLKKPVEGIALQQLLRLSEAASVRVAGDVPSGVDSDSGDLLNPVPDFDLTLAFGALKPAHRLMPAMNRCGRVVLADIGIVATGDWFEIGPPELVPLDPGGHKYSRGLVHCLAGQMPGAIALAATAAARAGAGYVRVSTSRAIDGLPLAIVQTDTAIINDERIGCLLVGPGMGDIPQLLTLALTSHAPKVIDADAIGQVGEPGRLRGQEAILTPHEGEFRILFDDVRGSKAERALEASRQSGAIIVYKGPDTLVAAPDGRLGFAPPSPAWLATAGTGDVLAGMIAAMVARGLPTFDAACAAVWLHGRAAEIAGPGMIADDLVAAIPAAAALA